MRRSVEILPSVLFLSNYSMGFFQRAVDRVIKGQQRIRTYTSTPVLQVSIGIGDRLSSGGPSSVYLPPIP